MPRTDMFNPLPHLELLLKEFTRFTEEASQLHSPNPEDDEFIRCGMTGFAQNVPLEEWNVDHFHYVQALLNEVSQGDFSTGWRRFTCLAAGYFLGMHVAGLADEVHLRQSEALTPGFMWLHPQAFEDGSQARQPGQLAFCNTTR
jgi:hypothetical protein